MWCCGSSAKFLMDSILGTGEAVTISSENNPGPSDKSKSEVKIDNGYIGNEVVVVKGGLRICGTGGALGSAPLVQTKSYFEVKLQQEGTWAVGVATRNCGLDTGPFGNDPDSWVFRNSGELWFNGMTIGKIDHPLEEGDVIVRTNISTCIFQDDYHKNSLQLSGSQL